MESASEKEFKRNYQSHLKHLKLKGMQPKTIDAVTLNISGSLDGSTDA